MYQSVLGRMGMRDIRVKMYGTYYFVKRKVHFVQLSSSQIPQVNSWTMENVRMKTIISTNSNPVFTTHLYIHNILLGKAFELHPIPCFSPTRSFVHPLPIYFAWVKRKRRSASQIVNCTNESEKGMFFRVKW